jgi:hypothetical protein
MHILKSFQYIKKGSNPFLFFKLLHTYSEPIKLFTMIVYAVINGILTVKEWAINPNA